MITETEKKPDQTKKTLVTSSADIDFPEFEWGISKGESRELPADERAKAVILSNKHISAIK